MSEFMVATVAGEASRFQESGVTAGCRRPIYRPAAIKEKTWPSASTNSCAAATISACSCTTSESGRDRAHRRARGGADPRGDRAHRLEADLLLITHHHGDHVEANLALKQKFGLTIIGPEGEAAKIPGIDQSVDEGDAIRVRPRDDLGAGHARPHRRPRLLPLPGFGKSLFAADTLFALGCGRLLECKPPVMFDIAASSWRRCRSETAVYCGHEYTQAECPLRADRRSRPIRR